jgi:hypothetical protein
VVKGRRISRWNFKAAKVFFPQREPATLAVEKNQCDGKMPRDFHLKIKIYGLLTLYDERSFGRLRAIMFFISG